MKQEPVAWMETYYGEPHNLDWDKNNLNYGDWAYDVVPLYTEPQYRELSNEEIEEIGKQYLSAHAQFIGAGECHYEGEIDFARAIIERCRIINGTDK